MKAKTNIYKILNWNNVQLPKYSDINENIINEFLLLHLHKHMKAIVLMSLLCFTIIFINLFNIVDKFNLLSWYLFSLLVLSLHLTINYFTNTLSFIKIIVNCKRFYLVLGYFLTGLCWGLVEILFFSHATTFQQNFIIFMIAGVTTGSCLFLFTLPYAAILFFLPTAIPLIWYFISSQRNTDIFLAEGLTLYFIILIYISFKISNYIKKIFYLYYDNQELVLTLSKEKNELEYIALHDNLTNVANRRLFKKNLYEAIKHNSNKNVALLYIDLDNFKNINDRYGHNVGDNVLKEFVDRLVNVLNSRKFISRIGGDEFAVILENVNYPSDIIFITENIFTSISSYFLIDNNKIHIRACIGISVCPLDGYDIEELINAADKAMYYAKDHGGNNYHFSTQDAHAPAIFK